MDGYVATDQYFSNCSVFSFKDSIPTKKDFNFEMFFKKLINSPVCFEAILVYLNYEDLLNFKNINKALNKKLDKTIIKKMVKSGCLNKEETCLFWMSNFITPEYYQFNCYLV